MDVNLTGQLWGMPIQFKGQLAGENFTHVIQPIILNDALNQASQPWWNGWLPVIIFALTAVIGIITWSLTEWAKRSNARYLRKEQRYVALIEGLKGYDKPENIELKNKFIHQLNLCWLYCPDEVIRSANNLLSRLNDDRTSKEEKENEIGEFMLTIRKDALKRDRPWHILTQSKLQSNLNSDDYKELKEEMLRHYAIKVNGTTLKTQNAEVDFLRNHISQLTKSINQLSLPPSMGEVKSKSWWQFWR